jgi:hypothetical protein
MSNSLCILRRNTRRQIFKYQHGITTYEKNLIITQLAEYITKYVSTVNVQNLYPFKYQQIVDKNIELIRPNINDIFHIIRNNSILRMRIFRYYGNNRITNNEPLLIVNFCNLNTLTYNLQKIKEIVNLIK